MGRYYMPPVQGQLWSRDPAAMPSLHGCVSVVSSCPFCADTFSTKRELTIHLEQEHDTKQKLKCHICRKMFKSKTGLKLHMDKHTGNQAFQCSICGASFSQKLHYTGHMNKHADVKPFQCPICYKCFRHSNNLCRHKKLNCPGVIGSS